jgi:hypothetical protein
MIPAAKETMHSVVEATQETVQGIGEGVRHGAAMLTGMATSTGNEAVRAGEETLQSAALNAPRATAAMHERTQVAGQNLNASLEDTKQKGLAAKVSEMAHDTTEALRGKAAELSEGLKSNVHELRSRPEGKQQ